MCDDVSDFDFRGARDILGAERQEGSHWYVHPDEASGRRYRVTEAEIRHFARLLTIYGRRVGDAYSVWCDDVEGRQA